jgi:hypothetical protein
MEINGGLPSGKHTNIYGKSPLENPLFRLGHGFNSYVTNYQRVEMRIFLGIFLGM